MSKVLKEEEETRNTRFYKVQSQTGPGSYQVRLAALEECKCTCVAYATNGVPCKHSAAG